MGTYVHGSVWVCTDACGSARIGANAPKGCNCAYVYMDRRGRVCKDVDGFIKTWMGSYGQGWVRMDRDEHRWGAYVHGYGKCT